MTGKVLEFTGAAARHEAIRLVEQKLGRLRRGEIDGLIILSSTPGGPPRINVCGAFAEQPRDAGHALIQGLHSLIERLAQGGSNASTFTETLPDRRPQWLRDREHAARAARPT